MRMHDLFETIGLAAHRPSCSEITISALGGFLGILAILLVSGWWLDATTAIIIVPSMGASAVLLFAAPSAPFSQPWNVAAGHILSALVGVACWRWIPELTLAASAGVGLAIGAMYAARCIHPPGGATALAAVIGSEQLHALGFGYVLQPILLNVAIILLIAVVFNGLFERRRYPARQPFQIPAERAKQQDYPPINHEDFVYALSQLDTFIDVSEDDLLKIYSLATRRHQQQAPHHADT